MIDKIDLTQIFNTPSLLFLVCIITIIKTIYKGFEKKQSVIEEGRLKLDKERQKSLDEKFKSLNDNINTIKTRSEEVSLANRNQLEIDIKKLFSREIDKYKVETTKQFDRLNENLKDSIQDGKDHILKNVKYQITLFEDSAMAKHQAIEKTATKYIKLIENKLNG